MVQSTSSQANLVVTSLQTPEEAALFSSIRLSWTVQNQGSVDTVRSGWIDSVYFSKDQFLSSDDWLLGQVGIVAPIDENGVELPLPLAAGDSYDVVLNVDLRRSGWMPFLIAPRQEGAQEQSQADHWKSSVSSWIISPPYLERELAGPGYLIVQANSDPSMQEPEADVGDNIFAVPFRIQAPDLKVTGLSAPLQAASGQQVNLSWTVANVGSLAVAPPEWGGGWLWRAWIDRIVFSTNEIYGDEDDVLVLYDAFDVTPGITLLNPGDSHAFQRQVSLPAGVSGSGYLLVKTDASDTISEWDEDNNVLSFALHLDSANLALSDLQVPEGIFTAQQPITLSWSVQNTGLVFAEESSYYYDAIYFSPNATIGDEDDILLDRVAPYEEQGFPLMPGEAYEASTSVLLPPSALGKGYLFIQADAGNSLAETNEHDNSFLQPIEILAPDLTLAVVVSPTDIAQADWAHVSWLVTNQGDVPALAAWSDAIFVSSDAYLDVSDSLLAIESSYGLTPLLPGDGYSISGYLRMPSPVPPGPRWLIFVANAFDEQAEMDQDNNFVAVEINLTGPPLAGRLSVDGGTIKGELEATDPTNPLNVDLYGDDFWLTDLLVGDSVKLELQASFPAQLQLINADTQEPLASGIGNGFPASLSFTPQEGIDYVARVTTLWDVDTGGYQLSASRRFSDLSITEASAPASGEVNTSIDVSWRIGNSGEARASSPWSESVYLSMDERWDGGDHFLATFPSLDLGELSVGESVDRHLTLALSGITGGSYHLLFVADNLHDLFEENERNNVASVPFLLRAPDLMMSSVVAPSVLTIGEEISLHWEVMNQGEVSTYGSWLDSVVISMDGFYGNEDDVPFASAASLSTLNPQEGYGQSIDVMVPSNSPLYPYLVGPRYLLFAVDASRVEDEANEQNNIASLPITILAPDLRITDADAPREAIDGETMEVSWFIHNEGSGKASRSWLDRIYVSEDQTINHGDRLVTSQWTEISTPLAAGDGVWKTATVTLPGFGPGQHYLLFDVDSEGDQGELDETNNVFSLPITIQAPDLRVATFVAPSTGVLGQNLQLSWRVVNLGSHPANGDWFDTLHLSTDALLDPTDTLIAQELITQPTPLEAGSFYDVSRVVQLPSFFTGEAFIIVTTDGATWEGISSQGETDETNNTLAIPIHLEAPDLLVEDITMPWQAYAGQEVEIGWTISNQGTATAQGRWLTLGYMTNIETGVYQSLFLDESTSSLAVGETLRQSAFYTLPHDLSGSYQVVVKTNYADLLIEGPHSSNNQRLAGPLLQVGPGDGGDARFDIAGLALTGQRLEASQVGADPDGDGSFACFWEISSDGLTWSTVAANSSSYIVRAEDEGSRLRLRVSYRDGKNIDEIVHSPIVTVSPVPTLAIEPVIPALSEGNIGSTAFGVSLRRSGDLQLESRVSWVAKGSGAHPATASDFTGGQLPGGTVILAPGQDSAVLMLSVLGDGLQEADESFQIVLSNPSGARLVSTASEELHILNDDQPAPTYSFVATPDTVDEGGIVHISVSTTNVEAGRSLWWHLAGPGLAAADFSDGRLTGVCVIGADGRASFTKAIAADAVVDPDERMAVRFTSDAAGAQPVGSTVMITLKEPSVGVVTDGSDVITGTGAAEWISGVPFGSSLRGRETLDRLSGGGGEDVFVLGDSVSIYYNDGSQGLGTTDLAVITDWTAGDRIQLHGASSDYRLVSGRHGGVPGLRIDALGASPSFTPEAIGFVHGATLTVMNLSNPSQFLYV